MGVAGAGLATAISEFASCALFAALLVRKGVVRPALMLRALNRKTASELFTAGGAVQLRSLSIQAAFLYVARTVSLMDSSGVSAAAHQITLQFWQLGGIALLAVSTAASVIIPALRARPEAEGGGEVEAACAADRLLVWGAAMGSVLGVCLLGLLPFASRLSPLEEVQRAARPLALFAALLQPLVGLVFAGEGVMQGLNCFGAIAKLTALGSVSMVVALKLLAPLGLSGVWLSFFVFNIARLAGVLYHHRSTGPLARVSRCAPSTPGAAAAATTAAK
jgi:Na+-driven multidrug efflux pump